MAGRTKEHIQVGYYLSRFGNKKPPLSSGVDKWKEVYDLFFNKLSNGRSIKSFRALKILRMVLMGISITEGRLGNRQMDRLLH